MADRVAALAEELWDELVRRKLDQLGPGLSHAAELAAVRAVKADWSALGEAAAGRHAEAARDRFLNPPIGG